MYNKMRTYRRVEAMTASKIAQVAILLEHCAELLRRTKVAIEVKDYEQRYLCTEKVMVILSSIQSSLAIETSAEAVELNAFFNTMIIALLDINLKQEAALCEKVEFALAEMASIWRLADSHTRIEEKTNSSSPEAGSLSLDV
ncbi:flagellar export chaperone FliS [Candidatus Odyssella thessalonicensis]|uniref:flagellar export chaperone FliS n=1 Tax=Candidatus Odyssella thessalonicensis TaxID=84647 RepID=UPI000225ABA2|nr:flagellar protein FliS [Candidatus Odyssella thessalonicensis]